MNDRIAVGAIDSSNFYSSTVAAGDGFAFLGGVAVDESGAPAAAAVPPGPYQRSPAARAHYETKYIYERWKQLLPEVGSSLGDLLQVEQYVERKVQAESYFAEALRQDRLPTGSANGATAQIGTYYPQGASISLAGMAVVPDQATGRTKTFPAQIGSPTGKFADMVGAGPYLFTTIFAMDREAQGLPADVRLPDWSWGGSEITSEAKWAVAQLGRRLASVGADIADVIDYTLMLSDLDDLYEFDLVMRGVWGSAPPARSVIAMRGSALPRREGAIGHGSGAARLEMQLRCLRGGSEAQRLVVGSDDQDAGYQSAAARVGRLVWLSSRVARPGSRGSVSAEVEDVMSGLAATSSLVGASLHDLLRVRLQVTDPASAPIFFDALRRLIPTAPPVVTVFIVDALTVPGTTVAVDGVVLADPRPRG
jgi:enamine deaminase RidA (YjgF/YER057c/UK114 family)